VFCPNNSTLRKNNPWKKTIYCFFKSRPPEPTHTAHKGNITLELKPKTKGKNNRKEKERNKAADIPSKKYAQITKAKIEEE
jgi:hypothetical protein